MSSSMFLAGNSDYIRLDDGLQTVPSRLRKGRVEVLTPGARFARFRNKPCGFEVQQRRNGEHRVSQAHRTWIDILVLPVTTDRAHNLIGEREFVCDVKLAAWAVIILVH
jgi:hypothetical protein